MRSSSAIETGVAHAAAGAMVESSTSSTGDNFMPLSPLDVARPEFTRHLWLSFKRGVLQHFVHDVAVNDMLIYFIGGIILGIVTCGGKCSSSDSMLFI